MSSRRLLINGGSRLLDIMNMYDSMCLLAYFFGYIQKYEKFLHAHMLT